MDAPVLLELIAYIRTNRRLPDAHTFKLILQKKFGGAGRSAFNALCHAQKIRFNSVGVHPTVNALRSLPPEVLLPEVVTARRLLPELVQHFEANQGQPLDLAGVKVSGEPGAMPLGLAVLLCEETPVSVFAIDPTGGAASLIVLEEIWDLDEKIWPYEPPPKPSSAASARGSVEGLLSLLVEEWARRVDIHRWRRWTQHLLGVKPALLEEDYDRLIGLYDWLKARVFPVEAHLVVEALRNFLYVLNDFLVLIARYGEQIELPAALAITKSWKKEWVSQEEYAHRADRWQRQINEFGNVTLELARAVNLVLDATRRTLDPAFYFDVGRLPLLSGLTAEFTQPWYYVEYGPAQRYPGKDAFFNGEYLTRDRFWLMKRDEKQHEAHMKSTSESMASEHKHDNSTAQEVNRDQPPETPTGTDSASGASGPPGSGEGLTWLHISDVHFGHGDPEHQADQQIVLDQLMRDLRASADRGEPKPDLVLITGDIAFSGGAGPDGDANDQYAVAERRIDEVASIFGLDRSAILVVPGNHDVVRARAKRDRNISRLLNDLRSGAPIDTALADSGDTALIKARMDNYLTFATVFGCGELWWERKIWSGTTHFRFVGLNTALLCADDSDGGKLQLGTRQLAHLSAGRTDGSIGVLLMHHPLAVEWLRDAEKAHAHAVQLADIHLHGHTHQPGTRLERHGSGRDVVINCAAALHNERNAPTLHGYNITSVMPHPGGVRIRVWPRRWTTEAPGFRVDVACVPEGMSFAEHFLQRTSPQTHVGQARASRPIAASSAAPAAVPAGARPAADPPAAAPENGTGGIPSAAGPAAVPSAVGPTAVTSAASPPAPAHAVLYAALSKRTESQLEAFAFEIGLDRSHLPGTGRTRAQLAVAIIDLAPSATALAAALATKGWL